MPLRCLLRLPQIAAFFQNFRDKNFPIFYFFTLSLSRPSFILPFLCKTKKIKIFKKKPAFKIYKKSFKKYQTNYNKSQKMKNEKPNPKKIVTNTQKKS